MLLICTMVIYGIESDEYTIQAAFVVVLRMPLYYNLLGKKLSVFFNNTAENL